jgi:hypothetical protein
MRAMVSCSKALDSLFISKNWLLGKNILSQIAAGVTTANICSATGGVD